MSETGDIVLRIEAKVDQMMGALGQVDGQIKQSTRNTQGFADGFTKVDRSIRNIVHMGRGLLGLFGVSGGIIGGIQAINAAVDAWHENLVRVAQDQIKIGEKLPGLIRQLTPGKAGQELKDTLGAGAAAGVKPEEMASLAQSLGSRLRGLSGAERQRRISLAARAKTAGFGDEEIKQRLGRPDFEAEVGRSESLQREVGEAIPAVGFAQVEKGREARTAFDIVAPPTPEAGATAGQGRERLTEGQLRARALFATGAPLSEEQMKKGIRGSGGVFYTEEEWEVQRLQWNYGGIPGRNPEREYQQNLQRLRDEQNRSFQQGANDLTNAGRENVRG